MERLLRIINSKHKPVLLPLRVEPYSTQSNCFFNVEEKISRDRGKMIFGWSLHGGLFLQAEMHAVWESPTGELIDITPPLDNIPHAPFIRIDSGFDYNTKRIDNIRINVSGNSILDDVIRLHNLLFKIEQAKCTYMGRGEFTCSERTMFVSNLLETHKDHRIKAVSHGYHGNAKCFCGSEKLYDDCHKVELDVIEKDVMTFISTPD
jgi:hypothetical protein